MNEPTKADSAAFGLFSERDEHEIGKDYGRGWIVLRPAAEGIRLAVGERGLGHDEPSTLHSMRLTWGEAAELRDALSLAIPADTEPTETRQWHAPICDACGEPIRSESDRNAGSYPVRRLGKMVEKSGTWHAAHTPKAFLERTRH